jgi:hypothetical protein
LPSRPLRRDRCALTQRAYAMAQLNHRCAVERPWRLRCGVSFPRLMGPRLLVHRVWESFGLAIEGATWSAGQVTREGPKSPTEVVT